MEVAVYLAIIGDLIDSRHISAKERRRVQQVLKQTLAKINQTYAVDIAANFLITLGDEFQGLLKRSDNVFIIMEQIQADLPTHPVRFGLGIGAIYTPLEKDAIGADGPAFHLARQALDNIKHFARKSEQPKSLMRLESETIASDLINHMFAQIYYQSSHWTEKQQQIVWLMRTASSQKELAEQLNVSQPYINQVLQATGYYTYRASLQAIVKEIKRQRYG